MKLKKIDRIKGELNLPLVYMMVVGTWTMTVYALSPVKKIPGIPCVFKAIFGIPCPTCGATRVVRCLARFDMVDAFLWNPLLFLAGMAFAAWGLYGFYMLFSRKKIRVILSAREKNWLPWALAMLILLDWIYLAMAGI